LSEVLEKAIGAALWIASEVLKSELDIGAEIGVNILTEVTKISAFLAFTSDLAGPILNSPMARDCWSNIGRRIVPLLTASLVSVTSSNHVMPAMRRLQMQQVDTYVFEILLND
jgi:hypothetical protein